MYLLNMMSTEINFNKISNMHYLVEPWQLTKYSLITTNRTDANPFSDDIQTLNGYKTIYAE